jgi:hypothetical protein
MSLEAATLAIPSHGVSFVTTLRKFLTELVSSDVPSSKPVDADIPIFEGPVLRYGIMPIDKPIENSSLGTSTDYAHTSMAYSL